MGKKIEYLAMKTDDSSVDLNTEINEVERVVKKLINDEAMLGSLGFGTSFLKGVASFSAM